MSDSKHNTEVWAGIAILVILFLLWYMKRATPSSDTVTNYGASPLPGLATPSYQPNTFSVPNSGNGSGNYKPVAGFSAPDAVTTPCGCTGQTVNQYFSTPAAIAPSLAAYLPQPAEVPILKAVSPVVAKVQNLAVKIVAAVIPATPPPAPKMGIVNSTAKPKGYTLAQSLGSLSGNNGNVGYSPFNSKYTPYYGH